MRLCIENIDERIFEPELYEEPPSFTVNNKFVLMENYIYRLVVKEAEETDDINVFIGDHQVPMYFNRSSGYFESEKGPVFSGCFDLTEISVFIAEDEENAKAYYTDYLRVANKKQTTGQIVAMLNEIEEALPDFLEVCFSKSYKRSGLRRNNIGSIWHTFEILDEIIKIYDENYGFFLNHKKASVEPVSAIVDLRDMRGIDHESLRWITSNPDCLIKTDKNSAVRINDENFIPTRIKTFIPQYSFDLYENRMVLGFLATLIENITERVAGYQKHAAELEKIPDVISGQIPDTHELTGTCVFIYYKGVINRFEERRKKLQKLFEKYKRAIGCEPEILRSTPLLTNTFKQVYHYRLCYECMLKWFKQNDYSLDHLDYLFKLKTLSRIFEYYCLIKFQSAVAMCGYTLKSAARVVYEQDDEEEEEINNQYIFDGDYYEVTLFYEPSIWVDRISEGLNLYSTGYNFSKGLWNKKWTPDFVIKIKSDTDEYYYIIDAKYSDYENVKKIYIPELVLKYSAQIASKDKLHSDVIGIGAVYPGDNGKMHFYKRNRVGSVKKSIPVYFSVDIAGGEAGTKLLSAGVEKLLKEADEIEAEKHNTGAII